MTDAPQTFVVEAQGQPHRPRYSPTGTPEGVVFFATRAAARKVRDEMLTCTPSKYLPLRVVPANA